MTDFGPPISLPVPGYEGRYSVDTEGRVFSHRVKRFLRPGKCISGHVTVALGRNNSQSVHALVLRAFVGPRPANCEARHLNGIPDDNRLDNLEWASRSRNTQDKKWHRGARNYKLSPGHVRAIRRALEAGRSAAMLARFYGVCRNTIYALACGKNHRDVE